MFKVLHFSFACQSSFPDKGKNRLILKSSKLYSGVLSNFLSPEVAFAALATSANESNFFSLRSFPISGVFFLSHLRDRLRRRGVSKCTPNTESNLTERKKKILAACIHLSGGAGQ